MSLAHTIAELPWLVLQKIVPADARHWLAELG
jgi:hypothetical protein